MSMKDKIMPPLVLTLICTISAVLLVIVYNLTYVDTTGVITDKLSEGLTELYGTSDGFAMMINEDGTVKTYEDVTSVMTDDNGNVAFEIYADGYNKEGLHLLIGFDKSDAVCGISVVSISETPGLGTKVQDSSFLDKFKGVNSTDFQIDGITGATRSSNGMKNAVTAAVNAYNEMKGEDNNG